MKDLLHETFKGEGMWGGKTLMQGALEPCQFFPLLICVCKVFCVGSTQLGMSVFPDAYLQTGRVAFKV